jgi:hypothetical protein
LIQKNSGVVFKMKITSKKLYQAIKTLATIAIIGIVILATPFSLQVFATDIRPTDGSGIARFAIPSFHTSPHITYCK